MQTAVYQVKNPKFLKVPPPEIMGLKQESQIINYTILHSWNSLNKTRTLRWYSYVTMVQFARNVVLMLARGYSIPKSSVIPDTRLPGYYSSISTNFAAM